MSIYKLSVKCKKFLEYAIRIADNYFIKRAILDMCIDRISRSLVIFNFLYFSIDCTL